MMVTRRVALIIFMRRGWSAITAATGFVSSRTLGWRKSTAIVVRYCRTEYKIGYQFMLTFGITEFLIPSGGRHSSDSWLSILT